ncbi:hypothetical protein DSO57_1021585 [Entomophthora muscae]|uniref:Uncharacterized protein n=1 Tax=Entomophthora muscae TaxID=34485 RepID=A0ACC2TEW6_9FUNG|nr:hypothetical protein DSO57_1021585 [Entomophthora muscae]
MSLFWALAWWQPKAAAIKVQSIKKSLANYLNEDASHENFGGEDVSQSGLVDKKEFARLLNEDASYGNYGGEEGTQIPVSSDDEADIDDFNALVNRVSQSSESSLGPISTSNSNPTEEEGVSRSKCTTEDRTLNQKYRELLEENYGDALDDIKLKHSSELYSLADEAYLIALDFHNSQKARAEHITNALSLIQKATPLKAMHSFRYLVDDFKFNLKQIYTDSVYGFDVIFSHAHRRITEFMPKDAAQQPHNTTSQSVMAFFNAITHIEIKHAKLIESMSSSNRNLTRKVAAWHQSALLELFPYPLDQENILLNPLSFDS